MSNEMFIVLVALATGGLLAWGFRNLPSERFQMLASLPMVKQDPGTWRGINLTWYGLLSANAQALAATWLLLLMSALGVPWLTTAGLIVVLVTLCIPGSHWLAQLVEKKAHTFTVGGASFLGLVAAPWLGWLVRRLLARPGEPDFPVLAWCAAITSAYALGEGLGRLACISFGCCYGRPLNQCHPILRRLFSRAHFVFQGHTKKVAYASGWEGQAIFPIQAISACVNLAAALASAYLFLRGAYAGALLTSALVTQLWRVASEFLRADFRGAGRFSAYQKLALAGAVWSVGLAIFLPSSGAEPRLELGLASIWAPGPLLLVQVVWVASFAYYGLSRVTTSKISYSVIVDNV